MLNPPTIFTQRQLPDLSGELQRHAILLHRLITAQLSESAVGMLSAIKKKGSYTNQSKKNTLLDFFLKCKNLDHSSTIGYFLNDRMIFKRFSILDSSK